MKMKANPRQCQILTLLVGVLFLAAIFLSNTSDVYAAAWSKSMSNGFVPSAGDAIPLKNSNVVVKSKASTIKQISYNGSTVWCAKIASASKAQSYSNFLTLTFPKAAKLRGQEIDITITFTAMTIGKGQGKNTLLNKDGYAAFARCNSTGRFYIGGIDSSTSRPYKANKQITTKITATWSSGGGTVNLPFYQGVSDVDAGMSADYYKEAWEGASGFASTFYIWPGCKNSYSGNKMTASYADVDGNNSWYQCGLVAPTTGGTFTVKWTEGNCETGFLLYNQYKDLPMPTKTVDKTSAVKDDLITWAVNQKVGTFYRDTFTTYSNYSMSDTIPEGVEYQSARIYKGSTDITAWGTLQYSENTRQLTFTMGAGRLPGGSFYNGETISMKITAKALQPQEASQTLKNTGTTTISGYAQNTNTVSTTIRKPDLSITKAAPESEYQEGETVPFTVTVKQTTENLTGKNVVVTDTLPDELTLVGDPLLSGAEGTVTVNGNTWTAKIPELADGQTALITFSCKAGEVRVEKEVTNTAKATMEDVKEKEASEAVTIRPNPMTLKVEKVWEDQEDFYGLRPEQVTVELLQDGKKMKELSLTAGKDWEGTFVDLPEWKTETEKYEYQIKEVQVPEGYQASVSQKDKTYTVTNTLKEYALTIQKEIAKEDYYAAHGDATFLFQITSRENPDWKWYEELSFTVEDAEKGGATLRKAKTVTLPYGTYEIEERDVLRYQGEITAVVGDIKKISDGKAEAKLGTDDQTESVTYRNEKVRWDRYSHNDLVMNSLQQGS